MHRALPAKGWARASHFLQKDPGQGLSSRAALPPSTRQPRTFLITGLAAGTAGLVVVLPGQEGAPGARETGGDATGLCAGGLQVVPCGTQPGVKEGCHLPIPGSLLPSQPPLAPSLACLPSLPSPPDPRLPHRSSLPATSLPLLQPLTCWAAPAADQTTPHLEAVHTVTPGAGSAALALGTQQQEEGLGDRGCWLPAWLPRRGALSTRSPQPSGAPALAHRAAHFSGSCPKGVPIGGALD